MFWILTFCVFRLLKTSLARLLRDLNCSLQSLLFTWFIVNTFSVKNGTVFGFTSKFSCCVESVEALNVLNIFVDFKGIGFFNKSFDLVGDIVLLDFLCGEEDLCC